MKKKTSTFSAKKTWIGDQKDPYKQTQAKTNQFQARSAMGRRASRGEK